MTAHETTPSDAAIGQAFKKYDAYADAPWEIVRGDILRAAREIEQGRGALPELPRKCDRVYVAEFDGMSDVSVLRRAMDDYYAADQLLAYGEACRRMGNRDE